jgi:hypothetical protein
MERKGKKRQEGQEGAKTSECFLPLLALLVFFAFNPASIIQPPEKMSAC